MDRRRSVLVALLVALIPVACVGALALTLLSRPPVFYDHSEVVAYLLRQRGVPVERVDARLPWPEGVNYYAYGSSVYPYNLNVTVALAGGGSLEGKIECRRDKYDCRLTIGALGMDRVDMPNISDVSAQRWPGWVVRLAAACGIRL